MFSEINQKSTAVFFHYFERNEFYKDNLIYFLTVGYLENVDFYIVICGDCSVKNLPKKENIFYVYAENKNFDFGGHVAGINYMISQGHSYENFIFINSSVRGPFINFSYKNPWINIFLDQFSNKTHLVGSSINIPVNETPEVRRFKELFSFSNSSYAHIQTMAYAMTRKAFNFLMSINFFDASIAFSRIDVICRYEIRLSQEILKHGWNIGCFLPEYNVIDYLAPEIDKSSVLGGREGAIDKGVYFGRTLNPMETLFIKVNRGSISNLDLYSYSYTGLIRSKTYFRLEWDEARYLEKKSLAYIKLGMENRIKNSKSLLNRLIKKIFGSS